MKPRKAETRNATAPRALSPADPPPKRWQIFLFGCGLFLFTGLVYFPVIHAGFICFDDPDYITRNPHVLTGLQVDNVKWAFSQFYDCNWHPVTWISHMLDSGLFGLNPSGHHATNLLLHGINAVLLFGFLVRFTGKFWRSGLVAALFALHPLHVESVAWIAERKDVLSTFFGLLSLWSYGEYAKCRHSPIASSLPAQQSGRDSSSILQKYAWYGLALILFGLGLLSKPMLVTWPFVMLLLDYWPLARMRTFPLSLGSILKAGRFLLWEKLPFFVLSFASSWVTVLAQRSGGSTVATSTLPLASRVANAALAYVTYLGKLIWPKSLTVVYPYELAWSFLEVSCACAFLFSLSLVLLRRRAQWPALLMGWAWFLGTLVPVIGLVQVGNQPIADRYTYIPAIGVFILLAWGCSEFVKNSRALAVVASGAILGCALVTRAQLAYWHDSESLFRHALEVTHSNFIAYNNLGFHYTDQGKFEEARKCYVASIAINPTYAPAWHNLGLVLSALGKDADALTNYQAALQLNPQLVGTHIQLGAALARLGNSAEALSHYHEALRLAPTDPAARLGIAETLIQQGRLTEACQSLSELLQANPDFQAARLQLGIALAMQGKLNEAMASFSAGLQREPEATLFHYQLAQVLARLGRYSDSIAHYRAALKTSSDFPEALNNLAWLLATNPEAQFRNGPEAVSLAERACSLTEYKQPTLVGTLAAAHAEAGRFKEAITMAEKARELAAQSHQNEVAAMNQKLLELYKAGQPYRDVPVKP